MLPYLVLASLLAPSTVHASKCFGEANGNIVIQAEDAVSLTPGWTFTADLAGFTGRGYIKYNKPNQYAWRSNDILTFNIFSPTGGTYRVNLYSARQGSDDCRPDECNDLFVLDGAKPKKLFTGFGRRNDQWAWSALFDVNHKKSQPLIQISQGSSEFRVAGRSMDFMVDRIVLQKEGVPRVSTSDVVGCGDNRPGITAEPSIQPSANPSLTPSAMPSGLTATLGPAMSSGPSMTAAVPSTLAATVSPSLSSSPSITHVVRRPATATPTAAPGASAPSIQPTKQTVMPTATPTQTHGPGAPTGKPLIEPTALTSVSPTQTPSPTETSAPRPSWTARAFPTSSGKAGTRAKRTRRGCERHKRSNTRGTPITLLVKNMKPFSVAVYRISKRGARRDRRTIEAGKEIRLETFQNAYFLVTALSGSCIRGFRMGARATRTVRIGGHN